MRRSDNFTDLRSFALAGSARAVRATDLTEVVYACRDQLAAITGDRPHSTRLGWISPRSARPFTGNGTRPPRSNRAQLWRVFWGEHAPQRVGEAWHACVTLLLPQHRQANIPDGSPIHTYRDLRGRGPIHGPDRNIEMIGRAALALHAGPSGYGTASPLTPIRTAASRLCGPHHRNADGRHGPRSTPARARW